MNINPRRKGFDLRRIKISREKYISGDLVCVGGSRLRSLIVSIVDGIFGDETRYGEIFAYFRSIYIYI